jgi:tRNA pseudouridine38-40 synthase
MNHFKLILAYDGTPFHGWQVQPGQATVQGLLSDAIHRTVGERVLPQGSGRTDAGVHALGQVASFAVQAAIPAENLHRALNRCLPPSVRVLSVEAVPPTFHARHSAIGKTYEYRIFPLISRAPKYPLAYSEALKQMKWGFPIPAGAMEITETHICPPILAPFVWPCPWPLDLAPLNRAAAHVVGTHDFTSFAASDPDLTARTTLEESAPIRTITHSAWHAADGLIVYRVRATGFLHHMVRNLVGTFVQAGARRLPPDAIPSILTARNRSAAGPTAPATGLFLVNVDYPPLEPRTPTLDPAE